MQQQLGHTKFTLQQVQQLRAQALMKQQQQQIQAQRTARLTATQVIQHFMSHQLLSLLTWLELESIRHTSATIYKGSYLNASCFFLPTYIYMGGAQPIMRTSHAIHVGNLPLLGVNV